MTRIFRRGDLVSIQAVVDAYYPDTEEYPGLRNTASIKIDGQSNLFVKANQLTLVRPFFSCSERVQKIDAACVKGTVIAMHEGSVWVKFDHGAMGTVQAVELEPFTEKAGINVVAA